MTEFEYAAIFYGILVALAIEAVAANFHRLLAAGKRVKWHWMAPATAVNASLVTLVEFWTLWLRRNESSGSYSFLLFLPFAISLVFMYLSAAATLPDEVPADGLNFQHVASRYPCLYRTGFSGSRSNMSVISAKSDDTPPISRSSSFSKLKLLRPTLISPNVPA